MDEIEQLLPEEISAAKEVLTKPNDKAAAEKFEETSDA